MKKMLALALAAVMAVAPAASVFAEDMKVAMITDYGDITDQSFNQTTYEAAKAFCEENGVDFTYYKPEGDSTADRVAMVDKAVAHGLHDLGKDLLLRLVQEKQAKVNAFEYQGVCWNIDSVQSYFKFNMDILNPEIRKKLFVDELPVFTKVRDEMPAFYSPDSKVVNSLLADGCQIEGTVENSVLFRGVKVAPGARVKNSIIMQDGQVQEGAFIENCILDKQTVIKRGNRLIGPEAYPIVIAKNVVI